ncbi:DUF7716 domain-containing protein [Treponema pedis]|nr:hypothetical protein [Treponema pedis]QSI04520.1 hypothetical protein DYQ05_06015 [Treponema pedis]
MELRKPYQLQEIIDIMSKEIDEKGFTNRNFCLYASEDILKPELICYLELSPTISDDDEEIYPSFTIQKSLSLLYYGQQFEDVLMNVLGQKNAPTIDDYILALDYYSKYDTFKDFE